MTDAAVVFPVPGGPSKNAILFVRNSNADAAYAAVSVRVSTILGDVKTLVLVFMLFHLV